MAAPSPSRPASPRARQSSRGPGKVISGQGSSVDSWLRWKPTERPPLIRREFWPWAVALLVTGSVHILIWLFNPNKPPLFLTPLQQTAYVDQEFSTKVVFYDPEGDPISLETPTGLPGWLKIAGLETGTLELKGTPTADDRGRHAVPLTIRDHCGGVTKRQLVVRVEDLEQLGLAILDALPQAIPAPDMAYVEANPNAPENKPPEDTPNFSFRDQQAANPEPGDELSRDRTPRSEGELDDSARLVTGNDAPVNRPSPTPAPDLLVPVPPDSSPTPEEAPPTEAEVADVAELPAPPSPEAVPALTAEADTGEGYRSLLQPGQSQEMPETPGTARPLQATLKPRPDGREAPRYGEGRNFTERPQPRPRPRPQVAPLVMGSPGPLLSNNTYVQNLGQVAFDAKFLEFGEYLQEFFGIVGTHWRGLVGQSQRVLAAGDTVEVAFFLTKDGTIEDLQITGGAGGLAAQVIARDGVEGRQPFREWTDAMVTALGDRQQIRIRFILN